LADRRRHFFGVHQTDFGFSARRVVRVLRCAGSRRFLVQRRLEFVHGVLEVRDVPNCLMSCIVVTSLPFSSRYSTRSAMTVAPTPST
jgi:hypothetical protein